MIMASGSDQRREPRVAFSGFVRLRGLGEEESVEAEIRNLSSMGMFVASKNVPEPGAAVFCRVVIGNDRRIIKGKVAWASPGSLAEPSGAGIEFIDISQKDSEVLRNVVDASGPEAFAASPTPQVVSIVDSDNLGSVEVSFEGLAAPIVARARMTPEGMVLTTKLPFLRVGSEVRVNYATKDAANHPKQGRLEAVSLGSTGADGVPRLLVELTVPHNEPVLVAAPILSELALHDTEPQGLTLPMPASPLVAESATPAEEIEFIDIESAPQIVAAGSINLPAPRIPQAQRQSIEVSMTPMPAVLAPLLLADAPVSEPTMRVDLAGNFDLPAEPVTALSALQSSWKYFVVAALSAAAAAFLAFGGDELEKSSPAVSVASTEQLPQLPPAANEDIRIERLPEVVAAKAEVTAVAVTELPKAKVEEQPAPKVKKVADGWRPISDPSWPFTVVAEGSTTTIFIPFEGEQTDSRVYDIKKPNGVVALLPNGTIAGKFGKYRVRQAGIAQVWVEARDNGLHARVLFGTIVQSHVATLEKDGLRVVATVSSE
jgi:hypothetical protein